MKIIITGATGRIGGAALQSALSNPSITTVIVLSRRELSTKHSKLQTLIKKDYLHYSPSELAQLEGAEACIWYVYHHHHHGGLIIDLSLTLHPRALGAPTSSPEIHVQYPLTAQRTFATSLAPHTPSGKPFRFVLLSGGIVVRDQSTRLPPGLSGLKQRGQVEQAFVDFEAQNPGVWKSFVARPWMVIMPGSWVGWALPGGFQIAVEVLAAALVGVAVSGEGEQTLDNAALTGAGRAALAGR